MTKIFSVVLVTKNLKICILTSLRKVTVVIHFFTQSWVIRNEMFILLYFLFKPKYFKLWSVWKKKWVSQISYNQTGNSFFLFLVCFRFVFGFFSSVFLLLLMLQLGGWFFSTNDAGSLNSDADGQKFDQ